MGSSPDTDVFRGRIARVGIALLLAIGILTAGGFVLARMTDAPLLFSEGGAEWIRPDTPFQLRSAT